MRDDRGMDPSDNLQHRRSGTAFRDVVATLARKRRYETLGAPMNDRGDVIELALPMGA